MTTYYIPWTAYGEAEVVANSEEEAATIISRFLRGMDSIGFDIQANQVDGFEYEVLEEQR